MIIERNPDLMLELYPPRGSRWKGGEVRVGELLRPVKRKQNCASQAGKHFEEDDFIKIILYWNLWPYVVLEV